MLTDFHVLGVPWEVGLILPDLEVPLEKKDLFPWSKSTSEK